MERDERAEEIVEAAELALEPLFDQYGPEIISALAQRKMLGMMAPGARDRDGE